MAWETVGDTSGKRSSGWEQYANEGGPDGGAAIPGVEFAPGRAPVSSPAAKAAYEEAEADKKKREADLQEFQADPAHQFDPGGGLAGASVNRMFGIDPQTQAYEAARRQSFLAQSLGAQNMQAPQAINPEMAQALQAAALGQGPSAAQAQFNQNQSQALRDQMAMASSMQGSGASQYAAQQAAMANMSRMSGQFADQSAMLRAQEMQGARGQYLQGAGLTGEMAMRQQDINQRREFGYLQAEQQMYQAALARGMSAAQAAQAARAGRIALQAQQGESSANRTMGYVGAGIGALGALGAAGLSMWGRNNQTPTPMTEAPSAGTSGAGYDPGYGAGYDSGYDGSRGIWNGRA